VAGRLDMTRTPGCNRLDTCALRDDAFFWSHAEDTAQPPAPLPSFPGTSGFCQDTGVRVFVRKETNLTPLY
jgi:hypothetical protein